MSAGIKFHKVSHFLDSSSNQHRLPHVNGVVVKQALKEIGFKVPFNPSFKINQDFDIPYLCGYDTKKDIAYFDKDFEPRAYSEGDATKTLLTHEQIEKELEGIIHTKWNYQQRHHIATHCERLCVEEKGWDWNAYTRWTTHEWHKAYAKWKSPSGLRCPGTLDMSPYVDEDDALVKAMHKAGAKDAGQEA